MTKQIYLGLAIHNHQPVGNLDSVFEQVYGQAYEPMITLLERHPAVRLTLHYSGPLLDWLLANRGEFIDRVARLVERDQVEIMTGGYYEPILPAIPDSDKVGQIRKLTEAVKSIFGYKATGLWLAERVWEPHLPKFLAEAGIDYLIVDDSHFNMIGIDHPAGYYVTEEQGQTVKIFPSLTSLRYAVPWKKVDEVVEYLRSLSEEGNSRIAVMGDDGEKFGSWPGTFKHCYEDGWLERMFKAIENNGDWLKLMPLGEYARQFPAQGRVYLPTASYPEMMEWALPAGKSAEYAKLTHQLEAAGRGDIVQYMRGGFWRNFLVKYPEINTLHKKMLHVHNKVRRLEGFDPADGRMSRALDQLWMGQCNCPYWHGVFGGSYLTDIRSAAFRHLIAGEKLADEVVSGTGGRLSWQLTDFDGDGTDELLIESDTQNLYVDLAEGGSIFEWDFLPVQYNLTAVMSRRPEAYHQILVEEAARREREKAERSARSSEMATKDADDNFHASDDSAVNIHQIVRTKEEGLEKRLVYDWYRRSAMIDHIMPLDTRLVDFRNCVYSELGDFVNQPYTAEVTEGVGSLSIILERDGHAWQGTDRLNLSMRKVMNIHRASGELVIDYTITNHSAKDQAFAFGSEWSFNLLAGGHNDNAYFDAPTKTIGDWHGDSLGQLDDVEELRFGNRWIGFSVGLTLSRPATIWRFPIETISNSEAGFERVYQGSCLCPKWDLDLAAGENWSVSLKFVLRAD
ncbi:MAG: DUF1926 domain-containing protein [Dehalococcoidia bacterium]|nr:DUF1926 domain-containing protein [Dehalococcoidia bacterium]